MNRKIPIWILFSIVLLLLISGGFGGNYFYKNYKDEIKREKKVQDSILNLSRIKEDSLISNIKDLHKYTNELRAENDKLHSRNNNLYYELKKRNQQVFIIDSDFMSNAKRIKSSTDRFYKANDTIK